MGKQNVADRDGLECFYCGDPLTLATATVEHLVPLSSGGNNGDANLALAHTDCNHEAGALSVVEKVKLREAKRGINTKKTTTLTIGDIRVEVKEQ